MGPTEGAEPEALTRRVLVIDDDAQIRAVVTASLGLAGWEVLVARGGAEGIALAAAERPDAILLDVMMPDVDGPATLDALHSGPATSSIPVIMLTASAGRTEAAAFDHPVVGVIPKPFDIMGLPSAIAAALGWPR